MRELVAVYDPCQFVYKSVKVGNLLVASVKQSVNRALIAFVRDIWAVAKKSVRLW